MHSYTHLPTVAEVDLVADQYYRNVLTAAHAHYQPAVLLDFIEAASVRHRVADDETLATPHVLLSHGVELALKHQTASSQ